MTGQREGAVEVWSENRIAAFEGALASIETSQVGGTTHACLGNRITVRGLNGFVGLGDTCWVHPSPSARNGSETAGRHRDAILAEVVGFSDEGVNLLTYDPPEAVSYGSPVRIDRRFNAVRPDLSWRGRVLDALGSVPREAFVPPDRSLAEPLPIRSTPPHRRRMTGS